MKERLPTKRYKNITKLGVVTTPYGGATTQEAKHPGVDIANVFRTPIPAFEGGIVVKSENGHADGENSFGNTAWIRDKGGNVHQYNHLNKSLVIPGQQVERGQQIAEMGRSGAVYSKSGVGDPTNLDYRVVNAYGKYKNPFTYVKNL